MCVKFKVLSTSRTWHALISDLLGCLGQVDGVVPLVSLRAIFEMVPKFLIAMVTERTTGECFPQDGTW